MKRIAFIGAVLVVVAALLALVLRSGDTAATEPTVKAPKVSERPTRSKATPRTPRVSEPRPSAHTPSLIPTDGDNEVREYVNRHGRLVRDHRSGDRPEFAPEEIRSPEKQVLEPRVAQGVREAVYDAVRECRASLDPAAYGDKPRAQVEVIIDIDEGQAQAAKALVKLGDVADEPGTAFATCVHEQAQGLSFAAEGHKKISQYRVTLIFPLR